MEVMTLVALISGVSSLVVAVLTHIKVSKCYGFELNTRTPPLTPKTPLMTTF